jgi:hypothetical protein
MSVSPNSAPLDEFTNLSNVFKMHSMQDSLWAEECAKVTDANARASATIRRTPDQSSSHAATAELQFGKVPGACSGYQRSICCPYGTTQVPMGSNL